MTGGSGAQFRATWFWLREARHAWGAMVVIASALAMEFGFQSEPVVRITGLVLQLLGIGTVAWGISETRALFGQPSLASKTKAWLARFPLLKQARIVGAAAMTLGAATVKGRGYATHGPTSGTI